MFKAGGYCYTAKCNNFWRKRQQQIEQIAYLHLNRLTLSVTYDLKRLQLNPQVKLQLCKVDIKVYITIKRHYTIKSVIKAKFLQNLC